jgi:hypothetical protein
MYYCNILKIKQIRILAALIFTLFFQNSIFAQKDTVPPLISKFYLETRFEFDYAHQTELNQQVDTAFDDYGFNGKYLNLILAGNFNEHFSYFFRQRIISKPGQYNLFDNTDFLYLKYDINSRFSLTAGKQVLHIGSFEYDMAPIDVYYYSQFWANCACFQLGLSANYTDKSGKNMLALQMTNSPYLYDGTLSERLFGRGLFAYSFAWYGNFNHFKTIYSLNMLERERGSFVGYFSMGNKFVFDRCSFYIDYQARFPSYHALFQDFSVIARVDVQMGNMFNLFIKGGYEQNNSEDIDTKVVRDIMVQPGHRFSFGGLGIEFRPIQYRALRVHAYFAYQDNHSLPDTRYIAETWKVNVGLSWKLDFLKVIRNIRAKRVLKQNKITE